MREPVSELLAHIRNHVEEDLLGDNIPLHDSLRSAIATSSKSFFHHGTRSGLQLVRLNKGPHQRDDDAGLSCTGLSFVGCDFSGCIFNNINFSDCTFDWCSFGGFGIGGESCFQSTQFERCNFDAAILRAKFIDCELKLCSTTLTDFSLARLTNCTLETLDLSKTTFVGATFDGVRVKHCAGVSRLGGRNTPACPRPQDDRIENPELPAIDRLLPWDRLRAVGRLPIFTISSAALLISAIHLYAIATWNDAAAHVNQRIAAMADRADALVGRLEANPLPDIALRDAVTAVSLTISETLRQLAEAFPKLPLPGQAFWLLVGTVLLAAGSSVYLVRCPPRIQRFSDVEWRDEIRGSPFHYAPLACSRPLSRVCVAAALTLGGTLTGLVALWKLWDMGWFVLKHGGAPWPFH